jgi:hypothetical protein
MAFLRESGGEEDHPKTRLGVQKKKITKIL